MMPVQFPYTPSYHAWPVQMDVPMHVPAVMPPFKTDQNPLDQAFDHHSPKQEQQSERLEIRKKEERLALPFLGKQIDRYI